MNTDTILIQRLIRSELYADYQKAFEDATELPLTLRPLDSGNWRIVIKPTKTRSVR
jgi:hypothetical protein